MYCRCLCTVCQYKHLSLFEGRHTWCKSHYILIEGNAIWITFSNHSLRIFIHNFTAGWTHTSCTMFCLWLHCMATERPYSFWCSWREYVQLLGEWGIFGLFHFFFFLFFLYFTLRLWYGRYHGGRWDVCLPHYFYMNVTHGSWAEHCWLSYMLQLLYFLQCIKCVYVHRSHRNAFICKMCCLSLQCVSYVVVMFSRLILKD